METTILTVKEYNSQVIINKRFKHLDGTLRQIGYVVRDRINAKLFTSYSQAVDAQQNWKPTDIIRTNYTI